MKKLIRMAFSLPADSYLAQKMLEFNKHERSVVIKEALSVYFGGARKIGHHVQAPDASEAVPEDAKKTSSNPAITVPVPNVLGDFED